MNVFKSIDEVPNFDKIISVGSYDGVHLGHRQLIDKLNIEADKCGLEPLIMTFYPHPKILFGKADKLLSDQQEQLMLLEEAGARNVLVLNFTMQFSQISHTSFVCDVLKDSLHVKAYLMGINHSFGHERLGNLEVIKKASIKPIAIDLFDNISSTEIRKFISVGDIESASQLLGGKGYLIKSPIVSEHKLLPPPLRLYDATVNGRKMMVDVNNLPEGLIRLTK